MMKQICIVIFILTPFQLYSQVDTAAIIFKAQLLTTSRFGVATDTAMIDEIKNQNAVLLPSPSDNLFFIRIDFGQNFYGQAKLFGDCSYYIAFNQATMTFYRLGGFDVTDLQNFFQDLEPNDYKIFDIGFVDKSEIDFACLAAFAELPPKKQRKRKYECFPKCSEVFFRKLVIPKGKEQ